MEAKAQNTDSIKITLPDGAVREYSSGITGLDIAEDISKSLAKAVIAIEIDGELSDLSLPIDQDSSIALIKKDDDIGLDMIRHDCAHVMAEAVQTLFPGTQVTIGPSIENGFYYDFARDEPFSSDDFAAIGKEMRKIIERGDAFIREVWDRKEAIAYFKDKGEHYKAELIEDLPEDEEIKIYRQGEWLDLCRGPHMPTTKHVGTAFKLMKVAGAYWRGDSNNAMLQRIYGTAWRNQKELDAHLTQLEEAEARDHRKLGTEMDLFHFQEEAPGQVFWHDNGWIIYTELMSYMRRKVRAHGYQEINTPQLLDSRFWKASGHWDKYRENMFLFDQDDSDNPAALKPMSCPGGAQVYKAQRRSYRELPLRLAEFGQVFRKEASGARHGLMRVQAFTQDDAHIFCTHDQLEDEVVKMCDLIEEVYSDLGMANDITVHFATRPEQRIGAEEDWDRAEDALRKVLDRIDMKWVLNEGDGAFYAPKLDFKLRDAIGREWQCGTVQVDMNMPSRLNLAYIGEDGNKHSPHMVHRAILGSVERFIGVMIEHYAGKLPLWLQPKQCVVASITGDSNEYAQEVYEKLLKSGIRAELDVRNEKINYKVREHSLAKVPALFVVGVREAESEKVAIRRLGSQDQNIVDLDQAITDLSNEAKAPF
ncbi:MAG: threonine--tRNA ligase [Pseudomonadota bacterium]